MYYVACKMKDSSITNALFILQKPCVAKADRNMSPLPSWIMLIAWYTNLHIGAKEIENSHIHSFFFSFISSDDNIFLRQWEIFLVEKSKVSRYQNMNALICQLGKILFILNALWLKEFIHLWAELFSSHSLSYIIFFNLKGQGLNSWFTIQPLKMSIFLFSFFFFNRILDSLSLSV